MSAGELNRNSYPNIVALWHLNGDLLDSGPNGYTLTNNATTNSVAGKFGSGRDFPNSGYLSNASVPNFGATEEFSIICWVKSHAFGSFQSLVGKQDGGTRNFTLNFEAAGNVFFSNRSGGADISGTKILTVEKWHNIIITREAADSGTNSIYVDGTLDKRQTGCGDSGAPTGGMTLGSSAFTPPSEVLNGALDEVSLWKYALTAKEIKNYYAWAKGLRVSTP